MGEAQDTGRDAAVSSPDAGRPGASSVGVDGFVDGLSQGGRSRSPSCTCTSSSIILENAATGKLGRTEHLHGVATGDTSSFRKLDLPAEIQTLIISMLPLKESMATGGSGGVGLRWAASPSSTATMGSSVPQGKGGGSDGAGQWRASGKGRQQTTVMARGSRAAKRACDG
ncbi:hypothetical protein ZWY2020_043380 [Hordeum vulgare]|nr:hypothetical protein ZWY2020_043380 [Hordeum vulgare]